jgi:hypothetical protein
MGIANMMSGVAGRRVLSQLSFQASGLHEDKPLIKVGEDIYRGDWQDITGTELYVTGGKSTEIQAEKFKLATDHRRKLSR